MGKIGTKTNRTETKLISDPHELYRFLANPVVDYVDLLFASDSVVWDFVEIHSGGASP